jgi:hypothetical protein
MFELWPVTPNLLDPLDLTEPKDLSQLRTLLLPAMTAELLLALFFFESNLPVAEFLPEFLTFSIDLDLRDGCRLSMVIYVLIYSFLIRHTAIKF